MDKITILLNQGHEISKFGGLSRIRIPMANFIKLTVWWNIAILDFLFFFVSAYVCVCEKRQLKRCEETPSQEQFGLRVVSGLLQPLFPWNRKIQKSLAKNVTLKDSLAGHSSSSCFLKWSLLADFISSYLNLKPNRTDLRGSSRKANDITRWDRTKPFRPIFRI